MAIIKFLWLLILLIIKTAIVLCIAGLYILVAIPWFITGGIWEICKGHTNRKAMAIAIKHYSGDRERLMLEDLHTKPIKTAMILEFWAGKLHGLFITLQVKLATLARKVYDTKNPNTIIKYKPNK